MPKEYVCIGNCRGIRSIWNIGRGFCRVNPGLFRGFVGVFVGPVGVMVLGGIADETPNSRGFGAF